LILDAIQFPNLNPVALPLGPFHLGGATIGPFNLRWYALAYIAGLVLGWRWMVWLIRKDRLWTPGKPALTVSQADDFLFWATLGVILGGRIGYVLFYMLLGDQASRDKLIHDPGSVFRIWEGGMSFHGGFIGVALAALLFTYCVRLTSKPHFAPRPHVNEEEFAALAKKRAFAEPPAGKSGIYMRYPDIGYLKKKDAEELRNKARTDKVDLLRLGDLAAAATPIGLFFGRIANFVNGELWGRKTDLPWGMVFCNDRIMAEAENHVCPASMSPRHPSQLYEACLEGLVLFTIINIATLKFDSLRRPGMNTGLFLVFYGLARASLETVREPDVQMPDFLRGYITMGMLLSIPMILLGAWLIRRALKQPKLAAA
jgi:phosphatidylglycerol:prolipoprotein diacylglycerol transferase